MKRLKKLKPKVKEHMAMSSVSEHYLFHANFTPFELRQIIHGVTFEPKRIHRPRMIEAKTYQEYLDDERRRNDKKKQIQKA